jgi:hypothetical protein
MSTQDEYSKKSVHKLVDNNRNIKKVIIPHSTQIGKKTSSVNKDTVSKISGSSVLATLTVRDDIQAWNRLELNNGSSTGGNSLTFCSGGAKKAAIYNYNDGDLVIENYVDDLWLQTQDSIIIDAKGRATTNATGGSGISFRTNSASKMYIHNNGTVSIGTTSPDTGPLLHVASGSAGHTASSVNTVVIEDSSAAIVRLASGDDAYGKIGFSTSNSSNQGYVAFYGSTHSTYDDQVRIGIGGSTVAYFTDSSGNNLFLDGTVSETHFFTEGHIYSSDQDLESGDAVSLSGEKIVKTTIASQKDVVGIAWYQVYKKREETGFELFRNVGDHVPSVSKRKRDSLGNYVNLGVENESGEWVPTEEFKTHWKVASIGDTRQFSEDDSVATLMGFKVCDQNGSISKGDLLVTSDPPSYLMKQTDDIIRSSTVGKAMEAVSFNSDGLASGIYGFLYCG